MFDLFSHGPLEADRFLVGLSLLAAASALVLHLCARLHRKR